MACVCRFVNMKAVVSNDVATGDVCINAHPSGVLKKASCLLLSVLMMCENLLCHETSVFVKQLANTRILRKYENYIFRE